MDTLHVDPSMFKSCGSAMRPPRIGPKTACATRELMQESKNLGSEAEHVCEHPINRFLWGF